MKVISVDNYDREITGYSNDKLIVWMGKEDLAHKVADLLNQDAGANSDRFYKVVSDDYKLRTYEP